MEQRRKEYLTPKQAAQLINVRVGWLHSHTAPGCPKDRRIPHVKIDGLLRFDKQELLDWMERHHFLPESSLDDQDKERSQPTEIN